MTDSTASARRPSGVRPGSHAASAATSRPCDAAHRLCALYGRRMTTEQLFRDHKSKRNGWSLRDTQLSTPDRLDRLLLALAVAYLLLCGPWG